MPGGRPSEYDPTIASDICHIISTTKDGLKTICDSDDRFPDSNTFYRWLVNNQELRDLYAHAKEDQLQLIEDEMLAIADDSSNDYMLTKRGMVVDKEAVQRSNLRIETRKWLMAKLKPRKYGERASVAGAVIVLNLPNGATDLMMADNTPVIEGTVLPQLPDKSTT